MPIPRIDLYSFRICNRSLQRARCGCSEHADQIRKAGIALATTGGVCAVRARHILIGNASIRVVADARDARYE